MSRLDQLKKEIAGLLAQASRISCAWVVKCDPERIKKRNPELLKTYAGFKLSEEYQRWYTKALAVVKQLLPDRKDDFIGYYQYRGRVTKDNLVLSFRISDAMNGATLSRGGDLLVSLSTCYTYFESQCAILKAAEDRLTSSVHEIQQILQADLFDSEVDAARELNKKGFSRAAGAMAGVVLEKRLSTVVQLHGLVLAKKNPCINDLNQKLKDESILDVPTWRFIQRLGDIRNMCDHAKGPDPTSEIVEELIAGVDKVLKTVF